MQRCSLNCVHCTTLICYWENNTCALGWCEGALIWMFCNDSKAIVQKCREWCGIEWAQQTKKHRVDYAFHAILICIFQALTGWRWMQYLLIVWSKQLDQITFMSVTCEQYNEKLRCYHAECIYDIQNVNDVRPYSVVNSLEKRYTKMILNASETRAMR